MPTYKDVDAILRNLPDDLPYKASVKRVLMQAPEADVVEVVRCKDCGRIGAAFCMAGDFPLTKENENCFCSYGERKD